MPSPRRCHAAASKPWVCTFRRPPPPRSTPTTHAPTESENQPLRCGSALNKTGALGPAFAEKNGKAVSNAIVPLQGASYQAAQYIAKALAAEAFATSRRIETVSANVAGITNTRSMSLPVFQAGFVGAKLFGIRVFDTQTTLWLSGLLLVHDWLNPDSKSHPPETLFERQIHGGVYTSGYRLIDVIKYAAIYGFARKPSLVAAMARGTH